MSRVRASEIALEATLSGVLGESIQHVDDGSRPRMHDADIMYRDGRIAALEITTVADPQALEMASFPHALELPDSAFCWDVRYPVRRVLRKDIETYIPPLVKWLELLGLERADEMPGFLRVTPEWRWIERSGVRLMRYPGTSKPGRAYVLPEGIGGTVDEHLRGLADWIESIQSERVWTDDVSKLVDSERDELHLFLRLHDSAIPFSIFSGLWDPEEIESRSPVNMSPLTDLWLFTGYGTTLTRWSSGSGWITHRITENSREAILDIKPSALEEPES